MGKAELDVCRTAKARAEKATKTAQNAMHVAVQEAKRGKDLLATAAAETSLDSDSTIAALKQRHAEALALAVSEKTSAVQQQGEEANKAVAALKRDHAREVASLK